MTGFEAAAMSAGTAALKTATVSAAKSLAGKVGFRWKVWWRVRSRVDLGFHRGV
jgi:hypothetical protein